MEQITYIKVGDYYIPDWKLPEETHPIGRWGRMHRDYLKEHRPVVFDQLVLSGKPLDLSGGYQRTSSATV